jgi:peptide/nickel transport system permease protein
MRVVPRGIARFILVRVLLGAATLVAVSIVVFAATQVLPGDPARAKLGRNAPPAAVKAIDQQLGLNRPAVVQYLDWASGLLRGDLGESLTSQRPIWDDLSSRLENSAFLVLVAALVSIPLGMLIGVLSALWRDSVFDEGMSFGQRALSSVPEFVVGLLLIALFATSVFKLLPAVSIVPPGAHPWDSWEKLWLPTATLVAAVVPNVALIVRAAMIEVLESEYVEMARLKGVPEREVLYRHALPNALGPTFQVIALNLAYLAGGVIVVESVFSYSGIGVALRDAVTNRDFTTVQAVAMIIATVYVVTNLLADIGTILVTPRLRTRLK